MCALVTGVQTCALPIWLARAASSLYWIGRHIERADFPARLIEAALQFYLLPFTETQSDWTSAMQASGSAGLFDGDLATATREMVTHFLAFDQGNPSSIISCLEKARNAGRAVRTAQIGRAAGREREWPYV